MNLLYDLSATQPSPESKFHGGGVYGEVVFFKLLEYLDKFNLICYYNAEAYLNPKILSAIKEYDIKLYDLNRKNIEEILKEEKIDRIYSAMLNLNQNIPLGKTEVYTTVHGLRTLEMPFDKIMLSYATSLKEKIKFLLFMTLAKKIYLKKLKIINGRLVADKRINVITISNHSLASIKSFYPETQSKEIPVFASPTFYQLENHRQLEKINIDECAKNNFPKYNIQEGMFFLITSAARWTKNALRAIWAFDSLFSDRIALDFKVVITGVTNKKIFTRKIKHPEHFVFLGYVDRDFLEALTAKQYAFIYPSLNEGFGYPPIESFKYGIPVAASGTSSIPEVCGNAAIYFDPYSVSEIKNRIVQLLDKNIYDEYSKRAEKQFKIVSEKQKENLQKLAEYIIGFHS
ncbi:glycosyltransferase [uncultured Treponema sp.]|uniref:glycosyltransferase n=2 Tax=Treponema TaxID=157 RepID=UPI00261B82E5|nr:glycosyltransferase [uncultured Treponema sp.]